MLNVLEHRAIAHQIKVTLMSRQSQLALQDKHAKGHQQHRKMPPEKAQAISPVCVHHYGRQRKVARVYAA